MTAATTAPPLSGGGWPQTMLMVSDKKQGPALYIGRDAVGFVARNTVVHVVSTTLGTMLGVRIDGPLTVHAEVPLAKLGARVQRKGRLRGTPIYLGPNDIVKVLGPAEADRMRVQASVQLGAGATPLGPFLGTYPTVGLAGSEVNPAAVGAVTPGQPHEPQPGQSLRLYDKPKPGAPVAAVLPATQPPLRLEVIMARGGWSAVRAGQGPYVIGFVQGPLRPSAQPAPQRSSLGTAFSQGTIPSFLQEGSDRTLYRVRPGTQVEFYDRERRAYRNLGTFRQAGYAREVERHPDGKVDVYVAADERVAIRGLVPGTALEALSPAPGRNPQMPGTPPATSPGRVPAPPPQRAVPPPPPPQPALQTLPTSTRGVVLG